jgi:cytochrome c oxidase cbb3-type subunit 4
MFANIHAWWTVLLLVVFVGIVVWAYSGARKKDFEEAARLPLDDDDNDDDEHAPARRKNENGDDHG